MPPLDADRAVALLMRFLAVEGITGQEKAIAADVVKALKEAGVPAKAIRYDDAHERIEPGNDLDVLQRGHGLRFEAVVGVIGHEHINMAAGEHKAGDPYDFIRTNGDRAHARRNLCREP